MNVTQKDTVGEHMAVAMVPSKCNPLLTVRQIGPGQQVWLGRISCQIRSREKQRLLEQRLIGLPRKWRAFRRKSALMCAANYKVIVVV
jgi:hypothetical protein